MQEWDLSFRKVYVYIVSFIQKRRILFFSKKPSTYFFHMSLALINVSKKKRMDYFPLKISTFKIFRAKLTDKYFSMQN
jgi:hypothetical protein